MLYFLFLLLALILLLHVVAMLRAWRLTTIVPEMRPDPDLPLPLPVRALHLLAGPPLYRRFNEATPADWGMPEYEERTLVALDGRVLSAWFIPHPEARAVAVMFHGFATKKEHLLRDAKALHDRGFACWCLDFRGCGDSEGTACTLGYREALDVLAAHRAASREAPGLPQIFYGKSMGCAAAVRAVVRHGARPAAMILEVPYDRVVNAAANRYRLHGAPGRPLAELTVLWGSIFRGFNGFKDDPIDLAPAVEVPVLVMYGALDPRVQEREARALAKAYPKATAVRFPYSGHGAFLEEDPQRWQRAVDRFLKRVLPP